MKDIVPDKIFDQNNVVFREMFKTHSAVMLLLDPEEGKIIEANNSASLFYGYSIEELCNMSIDQINTMPPEEIYNERMLAKERKRNYFLFQHKLKNDEIRSVAVYSTPVNIGEKTILFSIIHNISERELVSEKSRESEEHFKALIEHSNDVISILSAEGKILYESPAHERVLGYKKGELIKKNVFKFVHPEDRGRIKAQFVDLLKNPGETVPVNFRFKDKKGKFKFLEGAGTNLLHTNAIKGIVVNYRDVTDRKVFEMELEESEARFRELFKVAPVGIAVHRDMELIYANPKGIQFLHAESEENLLGMSIKEIIHPDEWGKALGNLKKLKSGELESDPREYTIVRLDGSLMESEIISSPLVFEGRDASLVIITDISERKAAENEIKTIATEWESTFNAISDSVFIITLEGDIKQYNSTTLDMFGMNESEIEGKKCFELVHGLTDHYPDCPLVRVRESGKSESMEFEENGRWLKVTVDPIFSETGELSKCVHIVEDISEYKNSEKLLIENNQFIESLVNLSPDILYIYDVIEKRNIYTNNGIERVLGFSVKSIKEMGDQLIPKLMHPEDFKIYLEETIPRYAAAIDNEFIEHQYRMKNINGEWHWLSSREMIFRRNPDGIPIQIFGVVQDVTEQKKNEEEIIRLKEGLEDEVEKKTRDLNEKVSDLQRFVDATVERELRMKDLYEENEKLKIELKKNGKTS